MAKVVGMAGSGGLLSLAKSFVEGSVGGGKTFSSSDVKHVYFVSEHRTLYLCCAETPSSGQLASGLLSGTVTLTASAIKLID